MEFIDEKDFFIASDKVFSPSITFDYGFFVQLCKAMLIFFFFEHACAYSTPKFCTSTVYIVQCNRSCK